MLLLLLWLAESSSMTAGCSAFESSSFSADFSGSLEVFEGVTGLLGFPLPMLISNKYSSGSWPSSRSAYGNIQKLQQQFEINQNQYGEVNTKYEIAEEFDLRTFKH